MRVLLIGFTNIAYMPYLRTYLDLLFSSGCRVELLYWNRYNIVEKTPDNLTSVQGFNLVLKDDEKKWYKFIAFLKFRRFFRKEVDVKSFDVVVFLTTMPLVLLYDIVKSNREQKLIADIRDFSFENVFLYRLYLKYILNKCEMVNISSEDFKSFLPIGPSYNFVPNLPMNILNIDNSCFKQKLNGLSKNDVLRILYIGNISYYSMNVKFLELLGNHERFHISYVGAGPACMPIMHYCECNEIRNVEFLGYFNPEQKMAYYRDCNMVFNLYGSDSLLTKYALSNKLYESAYFYRPILVTPGTSMESISIKYSLGYTADLENENLAYDLYSWYFNLDVDKFVKSCDSFVEDSRIKFDQFSEKITRIMRDD